MNTALERPTYTLRQLLLYFLRLGALGFGGPVALAGYMPVSYTHLTLPTKEDECRSRWSPYH